MSTSPPPPPQDHDVDPTPDAKTAPPERREGPVGEQVMNILEDVERQFDRLRSAQSARKKEVATIAERAAELDRRQADLESTRAELEQARAAIETEQASLADARSSLESERQTVESRAAELETEQASIEKSRRELQERAEALAAEQKQMAAQRETMTAELEAARAAVKSAEAEQAELTRRLEQAEGNVGDLMRDAEQAVSTVAEREKSIQSLRKELEKATASLAEREQTVAALQAEVEAAQRTITEHETQLSDATAKLELAGEKLATFAEHLREQEEQLEAAAAHSLTVEQQQRQIEELTQQLAEQDVQGDPDALRRKDERIRELTDALRQARGQTGAAVNVGAIEQENAELREKLEALEVEHRRVQLAAQKTAERLKAQTDQIGQQKHADENARRRFETEKQSLQSRIETLEQQLAGAKAERDEARDRAKAAPVSSKAVGRDEAHLRRRRLRLRRVKTLLGDRARTNAAATVAPAPLPPSEERKSLMEVRDMLATTERRMVRRWAASRTMSRLGWLFILLAAVAAGSWFAAGQLHPPRVAATVTIAAEPIDDATPSRAALDVWQGWHVDLFGQTAFLDEAAERAMTRRVAGDTTREALSAQLADDLRVDASVPGEITLTMTGTEPKQIGAVLDVVATTATKRSERELLEQGSSVRSVVRGERREGVGRVRYAETLPLPVNDDRFRLALLYFAGGTVGVILLITLVFSRLLRAKRLFDEENDLFAA